MTPGQTMPGAVRSPEGVVIEPGQVWRDSRPTTLNRFARVDRVVVGVGGDARVILVGCQADGVPLKKAKFKAVKLGRMRPHVHGWSFHSAPRASAGTTEDSDVHALGGSHVAAGKSASAADLTGTKGPTDSNKATTAA